MTTYAKITDLPSYGLPLPVATQLEAVINSASYKISATELAALLSVIFLPGSLNPEPVTIAGSSATLTAGTMRYAVSRTSVGTATTTLHLPDVATVAHVPITIFDWSTGIVDHQISLVPFSGQNIMNFGADVAFPIYSSAVSRAFITLAPYVGGNGWAVSSG